MSSEQQNNSLEKTSVDRQMLNRFYLQGKLNQDAYAYALEFACSSSEGMLGEQQERLKSWKDWASKGLLILGLALILIGTIFFFAFNWTLLLSTVAIFALLQVGMLSALFAVYKLGLNLLTGQLFLLVATVLVGVLLATFGQKYQLGADAYTLFMNWSIFTFAWTVVSRFATQCFVWLVITNLAMGLWWVQMSSVHYDMEFMIIIYMSIFNLFALVLREYIVRIKGGQWLQSSWTHLVLIIGILTALLFPSILYIFNYEFYSLNSLTYCMLFNILLHISLYMYYRYIYFDIKVLVCVLLSSAILLEVAMLRFLLQSFFGLSDVILSLPFALLLLTVLTIGLFTLFIKHLRHLAQAKDLS